MPGKAVFGTFRVTAVLVAVGFCTSQVYAADDLTAVFDSGFEGVSLRLVDPDQLLARRPRAIDLAATKLPGFPLKAEELSLVLAMTDPVGTGALVAEESAIKPSLRERLVGWLSQNAGPAADQSLISALIREADEPGVRVDIDTDTEEVRLEYRVGF